MVWFGSASAECDIVLGANPSAVAELHALHFGAGEPLPGGAVVQQRQSGGDYRRQFLGGL